MVTVEMCVRCRGSEFYVHAERGELYCSGCERKHAFSAAVKAAVRKLESAARRSN